jgi:ADP-ribose pyrophosphatase YjhB (NUDIX family)
LAALQRVKNTPVFAGAVVVAPDARILCQLRDNKPGIICPGCWSGTPGGRVEPGETPAAAIERELYEEFEVRVSGLRRLVTIVETGGEFAGTYHAFTGRLAIPLENVKCHEGVRVAFFAPEDALTLRQHPTSLKILLEYLCRLRHGQT